MEQNEIAEAKLRTARKGGQLLAASGFTTKPVRQLPEGISKAMSSRWQTLASIPEERWEQTIAHAKATPNDELTLDRMVRIGRELKLGAGM